MRASTRVGYARAALAAIAGVMLVAACGGDDKKDAATTATTAPTTTTTLPPPLVVTKVDPKLGTILADATGLTLYTITKDNVAVPCDPTCAAVWPPLDLPPGGLLPTGGAGVGVLGAAPGPGGTLIVTHDGLPLYRFKQDTSPADTKGEGVTSFGGTWRVVRVGESATSTSSTSTSTSTPRTTPATEPEPPPEDTTPVDTTPVDTTPVDTTPTDTTPTGSGPYG